MKSFVACLLVVACVNAVYLKHDDSNSYASVVRHDESSLNYANHDHHVNYHVKGHNDYHNEDYYSHPKYEYKYGVKDLKTGDVKDAWESRDGDVVKGAYTLKEADGTTRVVEYTADKHNGFNAVVKNVGHADHHQHEQSYRHKEMPVYTTYDKSYYWQH